MEVPKSLALAATMVAVTGPVAAQAQEPTDQPPAPIEQEDIDFCLNEALGVEDNEARAKFNPADTVGSGYVGSSLRRFYFNAVGNAVSTQCRPIIFSRTVETSQIYGGKVNTPRTVVFSGLNALNERKVVRLEVPFSGIKGKPVRGYQEKVTTTVVYNGGTYKKTGTDTVRGATDGV